MAKKTKKTIAASTTLPLAFSVRSSDGVPISNGLP